MKTAIAEFKAAIAKSKDTAQDTEQIRGIFFDRAKKYSLKGISILNHGVISHIQKTLTKRMLLLLF